MESIKKYILKAKRWSKGILLAEVDTSEMTAQDVKDFKDLQIGTYANWRKETIKLFNKEKDWANLEKNVILKKDKPKIIRLAQYWQSIAAILLIAVMIYGGYFLYMDLQDTRVILPGSSMAYLEVDNQQRIELTNADTLMLFNKSKVKLDSGKILYSEVEVKNDISEYHKINVPRNGEFYVQLSDGTKVWINSESSIGFKAKFDGKIREVDLIGEAYFEVAKDSTKPFIVRANNMDIRVLGTRFNVKVYPDEDYTYTTLNEGSVRVQEGEMSVDLLPNQQLVVNNVNKEYSTNNVDASIYSAWMKGKFHYKNERLDIILNSLSRWYDLKVFYKNPELKNDRFSIRVNRYDKIGTLLNHLELTGGIEFEVNNGALVVSSK